MTNIEKAIGILAKTNDGDDLSPLQLKLVEAAVNDWLRDEGLIAFDELFQQVTSVTFHPPWFHGIENMTYDHQGYVRWQGKIIEHFSPCYAYTEEARKYALELAEKYKEAGSDE